MGPTVNRERPLSFRDHWFSRIWKPILVSPVLWQNASARIASEAEWWGKSEKNATASTFQRTSIRSTTSGDRDRSDTDPG